MKLCRHDTIARFIAEHEGRPCSARTVRAYIADKTHPLPVRKSGRTDVTDTDTVIRWLTERAERRAAAKQAKHRAA